MKDIVLLGDHNLDFLTYRELDAAITLFASNVRARWVGTGSPEGSSVANADALWVVPGSPYANDSVVYSAIETARASGQPLLGTCSGFQYALVEFARNVAEVAGASHGEAETSANNLIVNRLACSLIGKESCVTAVPGTQMYDLSGPEPLIGFHWCNFGLAPSFVDLLTGSGLVISAVSDDAGAEALELPDHPFFLATLFQPQVGSIAGKPLHPIIQAFLAAA